MRPLVFQAADDLVRNLVPLVVLHLVLVRKVERAHEIRGTRFQELCRFEVALLAHRMDHMNIIWVALTDDDGRFYALPHGLLGVLLVELHDSCERVLALDGTHLLGQPVPVIQDVDPERRTLRRARKQQLLLHMGCGHTPEAQSHTRAHCAGH